MSLCLLKLEDRVGARRWARTARLAAREIGDTATESWVLAQDAYAQFYSGALTDAINVARLARQVSGNSATVGAVLAAALEGRALGAMGRANEAEEAIRLGEAMLGRLQAGELIQSALGYSEAQFRFHAANAHTYLGCTSSAWQEQERALELYPVTDFTDRALIGLDRATCLAADGDMPSAINLAIETLIALSSDQREGIIDGRAVQLLASLPPDERKLPAARALRDVLMLPSAREQDH